MPYRLVLRGPGHSAQLFENVRLAPLVLRLQDVTRFSPATDARLWSPRGRLITERINYWPGGRLEGSDRWLTLFPPRTGLSRVLDEMARHRMMRREDRLAEFRIAVGGYDGRVIGRLTAEEMRAMRADRDEMHSVLPRLEHEWARDTDFFDPDIW